MVATYRPSGEGISLTRTMSPFSESEQPTRTKAKTVEITQRIQVAQRRAQPRRASDACLEARRSPGVGCHDWLGDSFCFLHLVPAIDRKSTRLNSSHLGISYAVFCL